MRPSDRIIKTTEECVVCGKQAPLSFDAGDCFQVVPVCVECLQRAVEDIKRLETVA